MRFRISAVRYHLMRQLHGTVAEATTIRDVMICWLAWVAICCEEGFSLHGIAVSFMSSFLYCRTLALSRSISAYPP